MPLVLAGGIGEAAPCWGLVCHLGQASGCQIARFPILGVHGLFAHGLAAAGAVDKFAVAAVNARVQAGAAGDLEHHHIARLQIASADRSAHLHLFLGGARHGYAVLGKGLADKPGAVKTRGRLDAAGFVLNADA